jgi:hypothetical protein
MATAAERGTSTAKYAAPSPSPTSDPCMQPRPYFTSAEQLDWNELACPRGFDDTMAFSCVAWLASFFWLNASKEQRLDQAERTGKARFEDWLAQQCQVVSFSDHGQKRDLIVIVPDNGGPNIRWATTRILLKAGHIVYFHGQPAPWTGAGATDTRHYAIATGRGDEVSQKWYSRPQRQIVMTTIGQDIRDHRKDQPVSPSPHDPEYPILRDGLEALVDSCTLPNGQRYLVNRITVYEVMDLSLMLTQDVALLASR